jgi:AraC-like DNA-binding protein
MRVLLTHWMSIAAHSPPEIIGFRRSPALRGLEVLDAYHSPRDWRVIGDAFAVTVPQTWRGQVRYRGLLHAVEPGIAFCNQPDEAFVATPEGGRPGSFNVLVIRPDLLEEWLSEQLARPIRAEFSVVSKRISEELLAKFRRLFRTMDQSDSSMQLQSDALELSESLVAELVGGAESGKLRGPAIRGTARMRECLHEEGLDIDLETLASKVGLSRFQALRAFKRRYGLPPHAYQLCLRVARARTMLNAGAPPADVAVRCGFVDQSHLNRHFKRHLGVTPMQYANASNASKGRASGVYRVNAPPAVNPPEFTNCSDWRSKR